MMKIKTLSIALFVSLIYSCKNDLDINANYKETTIVYGLINKSDTIHFIKINKTFLGKTSAYDLAKIKDSSIYNLNEIEVIVEQITYGSVVKTYYPTQTIINNKKPGTFYSPENIIYSFKANIDPNSNYRISVKNKRLNTIAWAETSIVQDFKIEKPSTIQSMSFTGKSNTDLMCYSSKNSRLFEVIIKFYYKEINKIDTSKQEIKYIEWNIGRVKTKYIKGNEEVKVSYVGRDIYKQIANKLKPDNTIFRKFVKVDYVFNAASDEFNTYYEVSQVSTLNQLKPEYTNVNNGLGLFASRLSITRTLDISVPSLDTLVQGNDTYNLGFVK